MSCEPPRLRSHWRLVAASMAGVVTEAVLLWALGLRSSIAVAPQVSAPAPFGVFHDLRWLLVFTRSWVSLAGAALALLALRTALTTVFVGLAWPRDVARPGWRASLPAAALFTDLVKHTYRVLLTRALQGCAIHFEDDQTRDFVLSRVEWREEP